MGFNRLILPMLLHFVIALMLSSASTLTPPTFPIAMPGCKDHCGNVSIPFPFGITEDCYLDKHFFINCTNSSTSVPQPVLHNSTINVTGISLEGQVYLMQYIAFDCYNENGSLFDNYSPWMALSERFTFNSTANKFIVVGCDTLAIVYGFGQNRSYTTGCVSFCDYKEDVIDGSCSGIGCCRTDIPPGAWNINVSLTSLTNHTDVWDFNPCSYAFVVEEKAFNFSANNLTNLSDDLSLPVVADWIIEEVSCEVAQRNTTSYACSGKNSHCYEPLKGLGYRCSCNQGYKGNSYLPDGCQDINECQDPTLCNCTKNSVCNNTLGNYTCPCLKGYHGDGRGGDGCSPDQINWSMILSGVGIGTAILLFCCFYLCLELRKRRENRLKEEFFRKNGGLILQQRLAQEGRNTNVARIFTLEELRKATNNFEETRIIGRGGYGTVFKGILVDHNSCTVAIKRSREVNENQLDQFINEVIMLSQVNSRNVVKLLGCCLETEVPLLVYEFIDNGTLSEHLSSTTKSHHLSWNNRLRIASEIAGVLSYLHSVASPPIIHRDIKSANILLDQNYTAKVTDFGISKLAPLDENQVSTMVQGTFGYLDPEYMLTGLLTEKSDVYSFGVVLIELLTGEKALSLDRVEEEKFLANYFISSLKSGHLVEVLDRNIMCDVSIELLKEVAMIAKSCLSVKGDERPSMKNIARELEVLEIRAKQSPIQVSKIDFTDAEASLFGMQSTKAHVDSGDSSCTHTESHSIMEHMMVPIAGGR
ncbi:wall-associated receptor kinase 5-like [Coffea eugenioides]|uniref:wall-associated receptor kinase 5-like n=1 Tax=Coffea eugenioides TaxID=49369 RepID=UPI000F604D48|nr:wall-associated receptor kinase 5-like [Coffea eugenioides]